MFVCLGMLFGQVAQLHKFFFISFVSFGIVALITLACNELLWEARQTMGGEDRWQGTAIIFLGVFIIIVMDKLSILGGAPL